MDTSPSDVARLLRLLAVRAFALALFSGVTGATLPTLLFALTGICLFLAPVERPRGGRGSRTALVRRSLVGSKTTR